MSSSISGRLAALERTAGPFLVMLATPPLALQMWSALVRHDGSLAAFFGTLDWPRPTWTALLLLLGFALVQALLLVLLPGRTLFGPPTPAGARMRYTDNAALAWALTHVLFVALLGAGVMRSGLVFDELGPMLVLGSIAGFLGALLVYAKGRLAPSGPDTGISGNPLFDFYWGVELHPRLGPLDLKLWVISRIGMMGWSLIVVSCVARQYAETGGVSSALAVSALLQLVYIARFMFWEGGYVATLDIAHDRFGFYLLWGVLGWLPSVYPAAPLYLTLHPVELGPVMTALLLALGFGALAVTHLADVQRQRVRAADGECLVWGRKPILIRASYESGTATRQSLLLASGYWGLARHFHYSSEILLALAWTLPCGGNSLLPYLYPAFLTVMLVHRALRDERRCRHKYGAAWEEYCARVRYRMLPGIF